MTDLLWDIIAVLILTAPVWFTGVILFIWWPRKGDYNE